MSSDRIVLDEYVRSVTLNDALVLEQRIRLLLRPRPRWVPARLWRALVRRIVVVEEGMPRV